MITFFKHLILPNILKYDLLRLLLVLSNTFAKLHAWAAVFHVRLSPFFADGTQNSCFRSSTNHLQAVPARGSRSHIYEKIQAETSECCEHMCLLYKFIKNTINLRGNLWMKSQSYGFSCCYNVVKNSMSNQCISISIWILLALCLHCCLLNVHAWNVINWLPSLAFHDPNTISFLLLSISDLMKNNPSLLIFRLNIRNKNWSLLRIHILDLACFYASD